MSTAGSIFTSTGFGVLPPLRERRDLVACLDLMDCAVVLPGHPSWCVR